MKAKKFVLKSLFVGTPKKSDFQLMEEELPPVKDREILVEAIFLSVDHYMRVLTPHVKRGSVMFGMQIARVLESKHPDFKAGQNVVGYFGWRTRTVIDPDLVENPGGGRSPPYVFPDIGKIPLSTSLGVLGLTGNTAWFGLTKVCDPKPGETMVVSEAAGAVGSIAGQLGRILGLTVIGLVGSDDRVKVLKEHLNFVYAYNYKTRHLTECLQESAPNGVDIYFDNIGGMLSRRIMNFMNRNGRICVSSAGSIFPPDPKKPPLVPVAEPVILCKELKIQGFLANRWRENWMDGIQRNLKFIKEGKLKYKETVVKGFEKMDIAFISLFHGESIGKTVVQV